MDKNSSHLAGFVIFFHGSMKKSLRNFIQEEGIPSPLTPVPFSRLLRHAENTLALFFSYARHHSGKRPRYVDRWKSSIIWLKKLLEIFLSCIKAKVALKFSNFFFFFFFDKNRLGPERVKFWLERVWQATIWNSTERIYAFLKNQEFTDTGI